MDSLKPALTDLLGKHISSFDECSATADAILKLIEPRGESELRDTLLNESNVHTAVRQPGWISNNADFEAGYRAAIDDCRGKIAAALATPSAPVSGLVAEIEGLKTKLERHTEFLANQSLNIDLSHWCRISQDMLALSDLAPRLKSALASREEWSPTND
jgi:hypothetical protein